ncbi:glycerophosphodiester phosphodiesterase [Halobium salinum]|uniref:Glycerophosphodiester phosphodiesterase n=1 Tax=Halobium salinum TaxID=1364940 RepID=A0ABD5PF96_9EURY|nr:glycerophosphodiester phosphodiesterase [Halobium salinum]
MASTAPLAGVGSAGDDRAKGDDDDGTDVTHPDAWRRDEGEAPLSVAHRGYAGLYPENTVAAVEGAADAGADMVEVDVVPTADGDVVVFHDNRLSSRDGGEREVTDADGLVWERSTDAVTSATVLRSGETVPLLTEVLDALPEAVAVNVEFKNPGSLDLRFAEKLSDDALSAQTAVWRPFTHRVLSVLDGYDHDVLVSSFYEAALATVREADPSIPVAPLLRDSIADGLAIAREYDAEAVHPPYNMVEGTPFFDDSYSTEGPSGEVDLLAVAHEEGRAVNVYTVRTWYEAQRLAAAGVDGLVVDYPNLLNCRGEP